MLWFRCNPRWKSHQVTHTHTLSCYTLEIFMWIRVLKWLQNNACHWRFYWTTIVSYLNLKWMQLKLSRTKMWITESHHTTDFPKRNYFSKSCKTNVNESNGIMLNRCTNSQWNPVTRECAIWCILCFELQWDYSISHIPFSVSVSNVWNGTKMHKNKIENWCQSYCRAVSPPPLPSDAILKSKEICVVFFIYFICICTSRQYRWHSSAVSILFSYNICMCNWAVGNEAAKYSCITLYIIQQQ